MRGLLPEVEQVAVVSMARGDGVTPPLESVTAVTGSLARHHGLVVLDCGRSLSAPMLSMLRVASAIVVLSATTVRAIAASGEVVRAMDAPTTGLVVRRQPRAAVPPEIVAETLGCELWGVAPHDPGLVAAAEVGEPPWRPRSAWGRAVSQVLDRVLARASDGS